MFTGLALADCGDVAATLVGPQLHPRHRPLHAQRELELELELALGWPRRCKFARALLRDYSYKELEWRVAGCTHGAVAREGGPREELPPGPHHRREQAVVLPRAVVVRVGNVSELLRRPKTCKLAHVACAPLGAQLENAARKVQAEVCPPAVVRVVLPLVPEYAPW